MSKRSCEAAESVEDAVLRMARVNYKHNIWLPRREISLCGSHFSVCIFFIQQTAFLSGQTRHIPVVVRIIQ